MKLTDDELIDRVIKFSDDAEKIQLATYMERIKGAIIDDLEDAGMDTTYCTFRTEWGSDRLPGQYITHLEEEIRIRDDTIAELQAELEERKALTIAGLIAELKQEIHTADWMRKEAESDRMKAVKERDEAKSKLSMWAKLNAEPSQLR
jgi:hypothetical protein